MFRSEKQTKKAIDKVETFSVDELVVVDCAMQSIGGYRLTIAAVICSDTQRIYINSL